MNNAVEFTIDIENTLESGIRGEYHIHDIVFTEFDRVFKADEILASFRKCEKLLNGFKMVTISFQPYNTKDYNSRGRDVMSYRIVNDYGEYKGSELNCNKYDDYQPVSKSEIKVLILDMVEKANTKFIHLLKAR